MPFLRPTADDLDGGWTTDTGGSSLFEAVDETSASDTDFIRSGINPVNDICRVAIGDPSGSVDTAAAVTIRYRYAKAGADRMDIIVRLKEGTTVRATWTHTNVSGGFTTAAQVLSTGEKAAITDWNNLFLEFDVTAVNPASLFAAGERGAWYDPSDLSTLWQNDNGTNAVTADGQAVARMDDKSGNGHHVTHPTAANRPLYRTGGGLHWLEFDGVNDSLFTAGTLNFNTDKMSIFVGLSKDSDASPRMVAELSVESTATFGTFYLTAPDAVSTNRYGAFGWGNTGLPANTSQLAVVTASGAAADTAVITATHDIAGDLTVIRRNGVGGTNATGDKGTGNFANQGLVIGSRGAASLFHDGNLYGLIVRGASSTSGEIYLAETWMAAKSGVTL